MSPILVRPVREQLEHDRIIRLLPGRYKRRFEVGINPGSEQNAGVGPAGTAVFPDAVLYSTEKARRVQGVVEVETVESVNHLEVMSQWALFGRLNVPFHLYVPVSSLDVARRLSSDHQVVVSEIWSYDNVGDQVRFTLVHKVPEPVPSPATRHTTARPKRAAKAAPAGKAPAKSAKPVASRNRAAAPTRKAATPRKPARGAGKAPAKRSAARRAAPAARKRATASKRK